MYITNILPIVVRYVMTFLFENNLDMIDKNNIFFQSLLTQFLTQTASQIGLNLALNVVYFIIQRRSYFQQIFKLSKFQQRVNQNEDCYERIVLYFKKGSRYQFISNINIDEVELDSLKNPMTDYDITMMYTNSMIKFSYCIIFSCYFSIGIPILIIVYIVDLKLTTMYLTKYLRRSLSHI